MWTMMARYAVLLAATTFVALSGCAMAPVQPEVPLLGSDLSVRSSHPDQAKLVFVNTTSKLTHGADGTSRINVRLDGKAVGGPNIGEYVQIQVPKGRHHLEVWHLDVLKFRTEQEINVDQDLFVELKATPFSNRILVQSTMPDGEFRPHVVVASDDLPPGFLRRSTAAVTSYVRALR
jgi:hypothetical protein